MYKKRVLSALFAMLIIAACLSGCGKTNDGSNKGSTSGSQSGGDSTVEESGKNENSITEAPASDFKYEYNSELGGIEINEYTAKMQILEFRPLLTVKA